VVINAGQHTATTGTAESYRHNLQHGPAINKALECASKKVRFVWYVMGFFWGAQRGIFLISLLMFCRRAGLCGPIQCPLAIRNDGFAQRLASLAGIGTPVVQYLPLRRALTNNVRIRCTWRCQALI
jgi:hypothetical protein